MGTSFPCSGGDSPAGAAGRLARSSAGVLGWAAYATLLLAMAAAGHLVAWETGRPATGLAAMAAVGFIERAGAGVPLVLGEPGAGGRHDDSGHAGCAPGLAGRGSWWLLGLGLAGGDRGSSVLVGRLHCRLGRHGLSLGRRPAVLPSPRRPFPWSPRWRPALLVWGVAGQAIARRLHLAVRPLGPAHGSPGLRSAHTAQAVCEALIFNNLGLDAATTAAQAIVLCALLAGVWAWSRRRFDRAARADVRRINPLEAAGAVLVVARFGMVFAVRGTETTFENLRALGWYDAIPQLGRSCSSPAGGRAVSTRLRPVDRGPTAPGASGRRSLRCS